MKCALKDTNKQKRYLKRTKLFKYNLFEKKEGEVIAHIRK